MMARLGGTTWKGLYALLSAVGLGLIVWGFGMVRKQPVEMWWPPSFMRHVAWLLTLAAFVLLAATYVPRNAIKARLHHPMALAVAVWAVAHLLANGNVAHGVLFGSFLVWSVLSFRASRGRDRAAQTVYPAGTSAGTVATLVAGAAAWALFAFWAHGILMGIRPLL
jgi:uncharacterized membrane protein